MLLPDAWTVWTAWDTGVDRLWDVIEAASSRGQDQGSPGPERFGLAVAEHSHHARLDNPSRTLWTRASTQGGAPEVGPADFLVLFVPAR
ncbi:hypothetical protein AB0F71_18335 [Kitasatospora sp. NPDC028055]|uniref:hypothetical protein n=1 Tax=Kitasatospora sp. NPDC028055 TaxID=3155653 RepID=UPI0033D58813